MKRNAKLSEYGAFWLNNVKLPEVQMLNMDIKTYNRDKEIFNIYVVPVIGDIRMNKLSHLHVQQVIDAMALANKGLSTIKKAYQVIGRIHNHYCDTFDHNVDILRRINIPKNVTTSVTEKKHVYSPEDCMRIVKKAHSMYDTSTELRRLSAYAFEVLAYGNFSCIGELFGLKWENVDFDRNIIVIKRTATQRSKAEGGAYIHIKEFPACKVIEMSERVKGALLNMYSITKNYEYVMFDRERGDIMLANSFGKRFRKVVEALGLYESGMHNTTLDEFCTIVPSDA